MSLPDPPAPSPRHPPFCNEQPERPPFPEQRPSRDEVIATEALRRRALAIARRLPEIIREAPYEELDELIDIFHWFGSPEAMRLEAPEEYFRVPGLSLEEANALVRLRLKRSRLYVPPGNAGAETPSPAPAS
jgi:hypothetical protein